MNPSVVLPKSPSSSSPSVVESFGWSDFPLMTSEDWHVPIPFPLNTTADNSNIKTASHSLKSFASALEYEEDNLLISNSSSNNNNKAARLLSPEDDSEDERTTATPAVASSTSSASTTRTAKPAKQVGFDKVHIREHNVVLGVHPLAVGGYPLELGWEYNEAKSCSVNAYERQQFW